MDNIISVLLVLSIASFIYGMLQIKKLLASGEVTNFNIMSVQNLSDKNRLIKKQMLIGFSVFILAIFIMVIITSIYGPIKG